MSDHLSHAGLIAGHCLFVCYLVERTKQVPETSLTCPWTTAQGITHEHACCQTLSKLSFRILLYITATPIHNISDFASQLCKYVLCLTLVSQCLAIVDQILGNCATLRVSTCSFQTTELSAHRGPCLFLSSFPCSLQRSELTGDMGGWCQPSPLGIRGSSGVLWGWAAAPKGKTGSRDGREREGTARCCSALFVFSHVSAKEGDAGCRWLGLFPQKVCACVYIHKLLVSFGTPQGWQICI